MESTSVDYSYTYTPKKTWHKNFDNGKINAFLIDFKTEKRFTEIDGEKKEIYGQRLFVNVPEDEKGIFAGERLTFFIAFNPYFYSIPKQGETKNILHLLNCSSPQKGKENDDFLIQYKSTHRLSETMGVRYVQLVQKDIFDLEDEKYTENIIAIRIILWRPKDVPKYAAYMKSNESIIECREFDVPFSIRCMLDLGLYVGCEYSFLVKNGNVENYEKINTFNFPKLKIFTFDIEVMKKPVQPPQPDDPINMIGFKFMEQGFILNNTELTLQKKIPSFWIGVDKGKLRQFTDEEASLTNWKYKPVYFNVINCENEEKSIRLFKTMLVKFKPDYINGFANDFFDWGHIIKRSQRYDIQFDDIFDRDERYGAYKMYGTIMSDTQNWVKRDSYLSKGKKGLKSASKELLEIEAIEVDHEEQVKIWKKIKTEYLNESHPNYNPEKAFEETFNFAKYNASDVYITDIFAKDTSLPFNMTLTTMVSIPFFEIEKKTRAPLCENILMKKIKGKIIAPNRFKGRRRTDINPSKIQSEFGIITQEIDKRTADEDDEKEKFDAICLDGKQMAKHCEKCPDKACFKSWVENWRPNGKQEPYRCKRDSKGDALSDNDVYFIPLKNENYKVMAEKYEGAMVRCFQSGVFKSDIKYDFKIDIESLDKIFELYKDALARIIKKYEKNNVIIDDEKISVPITILNKDKLEKFIISRFEQLKKELVKKGDHYFWKGFPVIIHVDVASMYPNIIINFNLQPWAVVTEKDCTKCKYKYNKENKEPPCWVDIRWNAAYDVIKATEDERIKAEKEIEEYLEKNEDIDDEMIKKIYGKYVKSKKKNVTYKFPVVSRFCQKKNRTFVDTVKNSRDGRNKFKYQMRNADKDIEKKEGLKKSELLKEELQKIEEEISKIALKKGYARNMEKGLKVLLNSFYGYMKSRGARFWSMDVAGATCMKGQEIISFAIDFCNKIAINIEIDTDGLWTALPSIIPINIEIEYSYTDANGKIIQKSDEINIFNEMLNEIIKEKFTNESNYIPCGSDGNVRDIHGNIVDDPINFQSDLFDYYSDEAWKKDKHWKPIPQCTIKFDADMGFDVVYVEKKKKMKMFEKNNEGKYSTKDVTGLSEIRGGELEMIKEMTEKATNALCIGNTLEEVYQNSCNVVNTYIDQINEKTLPKNLLFESKDISETTSPKIAYAMKKSKEFFSKKGIDPDKFPINIVYLQEITQKHPEWKEVWLGKDSILSYINRSPYTMAGFRTLDMGIPVKENDTIQWIITEYPQYKTKSGLVKKAPVSQRVVPTILFDGDKEFIKKYIKRWLGVDKDDTDIINYIDWDEYKQRLHKSVKAYIVKPAKDQGIDVYKWLKFENPKKKKNPMALTKSLLSIGKKTMKHPLLGTKKSV